MEKFLEFLLSSGFTKQKLAPWNLDQLERMEFVESICNGFKCLHLGTDESGCQTQFFFDFEGKYFARRTLKVAQKKETV